MVITNSIIILLGFFNFVNYEVNFSSLGLNYEADEEEEEASVNPLGDEDNGMGSSANVKKDLSDWQEKHAVLVLSKSKVFS